MTTPLNCHSERSEESLVTLNVTLNEVKGLLLQPEDSSPETGSDLLSEVKVFVSFFVDKSHKVYIPLG